MMNKRIIALLVAIATVNASMFAFIDDVLRAPGRAAESVVSAPADVATGGRTWEERHDRWRDQDADRLARENERYQQSKENYRDRYYDYE